MNEYGTLIERQLTGKRSTCKESERERDIPLLLPLDTQLIKHRARLGIFSLFCIQTAPLLCKTYKEHLIYFHITATKCIFCPYSSVYVIDPEVTSFLLTIYNFLRNIHVRKKPGFHLIVCWSIFIIDRISDILY
jgi:hypothetical protein